LLPVWGHTYIRRFLDYSLPTLLAPGNLPAIAKVLPCEFIFLTTSEGAAILRDHPGCRQLGSVCKVDFQSIDDLITDDNYSTTITLAYARAVRAAGAAMTDTCFFFMIGDYLVADGSLANVLNRMMTGCSGIQAGNFQVVEDLAIQTFYKTFDRGVPELVLPARDLMRWALKFLHPMTAANMVNFELCHSAHSNRLFWRVDESTLIGHFYLMHMICIRPEVTDFVVGSSCDYSFVPEMCPSGNIEAMTDSDDYLVVEIQPRNHENQFVRLGPTDRKTLVASLSEWTTERHRLNSSYTLTFHTEDLSTAVMDIASEAGAFIAKLNAELPSTPQPYRDHPYWIGAIEAHQWALRQKSPKNQEHDSHEAGSLDGFAPARGFRGKLTAMIQYLRFAIFGRPPAVHPWHPRWPDYRIIASMVRAQLGPNRKRVLVLSRSPVIFADWLANTVQTVTSWHSNRLLDLMRFEYMPMVGCFDACLLFLTEDELALGGQFIDRIRPLLSQDGFILVAATSGRGRNILGSFGTTLTACADRFLNLSTWITKVELVSASWLRIACLRGLLSLWEFAVRGRSIIFLPVTLVAAAFLVLLSLGCNLASMLSRMPTFRHRLFSSVFIIMRPTTKTAELPTFSSQEGQYWQTRHAKRAVAAVGAMDSHLGRA
jgi:hypothetical protein